ncbi:hypothetical protein P280DRAFT_38854 [Massarina eburnea CBS 473.64]|uniref:Uncharacterized protein n=1 Tax=Massarina eburnea CBS 473.64 TaxID=1395130 RepID=A0A6A6RWI5_9PLEO|nr:hypothetical protein P280DRAFT_38854 [Massarina eburnea CBS 473.64]
MPRFTTDITEIPDIFEPVPQVQPQGRQRVNIHTTIRDALKAIETNHLCGERDLIERYTEVLVRTLQQWKDDLSTPPKYLAHILEEQYLAEDGYSQEYRLSKLNDQDSAAGQALQKACEVTGCSLFISALMRTKVEVTPEGSDFEEYATSSDVDYETCWELDHIVDMSGQLLCYGAQTSQDEILDLERFYDFVEDIEDGVALSVFLIVPHVHIFLDILADATPNNMQPLLTYFRLRYHDEIAAQEKHTTVHRLCTRFIEREEARLREGSRKSNLSRYKHPVVSVIDATLFMDDIPLLKRSLRCLRNVAVSVFVELRDRVEKIPFAYLVEGLQIF